MALNTSKCNHLTPLHFKGLTLCTCKCWNRKKRKSLPTW